MRLNTNHQIFTLESEGIYSAILRHSELNCKINSTLGLEDLLLACRLSFGSIGMVEICDGWSEKRLAETLITIHRSTHKSPEIMLFAVGSQHLSEISKELMIMGFGQVFASSSNANRIAVAANRYWNSLDWPELNLEELVIGNLPWAPIE